MLKPISNDKATANLQKNKGIYKSYLEITILAPKILF